MGNQKTASLVHNPAAGQGRPSAAELVAAVRAAGYEPVYHSSAEHDLAGLALAEFGDLVVAAGGDGTVAKVAFRLVGRGVPVAVVPLGGGAAPDLERPWLVLGAHASRPTTSKLR